MLTDCMIVAEWSVVAASRMLPQPAGLSGWSLLLDS